MRSCSQLSYLNEGHRLESREEKEETQSQQENVGPIPSFHLYFVFSSPRLELTAAVPSRLGLGSYDVLIVRSKQSNASPTPLPRHAHPRHS